MAQSTLPRSAPRLVVAGAGAFGLACALALARRGGQVTVCDPARVGDNASGVAAGMLAPGFEALLDPPSKDHFALLSTARAAWPAFAASIGLTVERDGAMWAGPDAAGIEARLLAAGARARRLSAVEARAAVAGLAWDGEAVFTPEDWRIDAPSAVVALRSAAQAAGVAFVTQAVRGFSAGAATLDDGARLVADGLIVAVGAARSELAPELSALTPVKGHILRVHGGPAQGPVVRGEGCYVRPHPAGAVVGATMELGRDDRHVDPAIAADLLARAARLFPSLAGNPYLAATGVRATTADGLPWIGPSAAAGVSLAIGARRNGWLLAPLVGEAIAALAFGEPGPAMAAVLAPGRET